MLFIHKFSKILAKFCRHDADASSRDPRGPDGEEKEKDYEEFFIPSFFPPEKHQQPLRDRVRTVLT